jgi:hypothetical protein
MKAFIFQLCIGLGFWMFIAGLISFSSAARQKSDSPALLKPAAGTSGMVSSGHPIATEAGLEILKKGGNAFDAAVAVAAGLNVVEPMMSGMGGYGTILIYDAKKGEVRFLNSSGRIPAEVDSDAFRAQGKSDGRPRGKAKAFRRLPDDHFSGTEAVGRSRDAGRTHDRPDRSPDGDVPHRFRDEHSRRAGGAQSQFYRAG